MKIVSLITARGGSVGIPKKNIIDVKGKPLLWYTVNASLNSNVEETWVSTDSKEISKVALECGANVIPRPKDLANNIIMPDAALVHFAKNVAFDIIVFIQPTSPLLESSFINEGLAMMSKYDSVFSGYKEHWLPRWTLEGTPISWNTNYRPRRQDVEESFVENGAFYITTREGLLHSNLRYSGNIGIVEMPMSKSYQLDTNDDLEIIKKLL